MELENRQYSAVQYNKERYGIRAQTIQWSIVHDVIWN